ncbi:hypothetical protein [Paraliobacillus sp. JSM ZJ581]|uniref:hypothetical protein n=1 Tax=Paraliobacillus sp. JSM ZJ581 TaxID=3342118 RepID=UPI0035A92F9E
MMLLSVCYVSASLSTKLINIGDFVLNLTFLLAPVLFLHFIYLFYREHNRVWFSRKFISFLYIISVGVFIFVSYSQSGDSVNEILVLISTFLGIVTFIIAKLFTGFRNLKRDLLGDTFRWMFYAFALSISPFVFFYIVPIIFGREVIIRPELATLSLFLFPIIFLYLLTTEKLFMLKLYFKQIPYYLFLSILPSIFSTAVYAHFMSENVNIVKLSQFFLVMSIIYVSFLFIKNYLDRVLRSKLFVDKAYYQRSLYRFSELIGKQTNMNEILNAVQKEIEEVKKIEKTIQVEVSKKHHFVCLAENDEKIINIVRLINNQSLYVGKVIQDKNYFALVVGSKPNFYLIIIGKNETVTSLTIKEIEWLTTLAYYSNIAIENMLKMEDLLFELNDYKKSTESSWLQRFLFRWSEKERRQLGAAPQKLE